MNTSITLKEIAKSLNLSISTVSKSINNSPEISTCTKERVLQLVKELNYMPNHIATSLKTRKTNTIGVIVPDILNYFFVKALHAIVKVCREKGIKVITCISNEQYENEVDNVNILANGSVDGLIISLSKETQHLEKYSHIQHLLNNKIPVILFDRITDKIACEKIVSDDFSGAFNATRYLLGSGSKNLGLITIHEDLSVVKLRINGFHEAVESDSVNSKVGVLSVVNFEEAESLIKNFLLSGNFDSIFCVDERLSVKVLKVAMQLNYKIPSEFRVIGFSNGELSEEFYPSLSVVDLHAKTIGRTAATNLIETLAAGTSMTKNHIISVKSTLIHRGSTRGELAMV